MTDTNYSWKKTFMWTVLFAPYGFYLMVKHKQFKMLGAIMVLGVISSLVIPEQQIKKPVARVTHSDAKKMSLREIYNQANQMLKEGLAMSKLRQSHDLSDIEICGKKMRKYQAHVKLLRSSNNLLEQTTSKVQLGSALISLNLCVSCSRTLADQNCEQAKTSLSNVKL